MDEKRIWIAGRVLTLLSHYWRDDDPVELTSAIACDWADVLEGLPEDAIQKACLIYIKTKPDRKPGPGHIYKLAMNEIPKPAPVPRVDPDDREERKRVTKEQADAILEKYEFTGIKKIKACPDD